MPEKLIINARSHLGWQRRLLTDVGTALMWCGWLYLWYPVFRTYKEVAQLNLGFGSTTLQVLEEVSPVSLEHSIAALLGTTTLLLLWTLLPKLRAQTAQTVQDTDDYARHFGLEKSSIESGRKSSVCIVHHDEHGKIMRIEEKHLR